MGRCRSVCPDDTLELANRVALPPQDLKNALRSHYPAWGGQVGKKPLRWNGVPLHGSDGGISRAKEKPQTRSSLSLPAKPDAFPDSSEMTKVGDLGNQRENFPASPYINSVPGANRVQLTPPAIVRDRGRPCQLRQVIPGFTGERRQESYLRISHAFGRTLLH